MCRFNLNKIIPKGSTLYVHFPNEAGEESIWQFISGVAKWNVVK